MKIQTVVNECIAEANRTEENGGDAKDAAADVAQRLYDVYGVRAIIN